MLERRILFLVTHFSKQSQYPIDFDASKCLDVGVVGGWAPNANEKRSFKEMTLLLLEVPGKNRMWGKDLGAVIGDW